MINDKRRYYNSRTQMKKKPVRKKNKALTYVLRTLSVILTVVLVLLCTVWISLKMIGSDSNLNAQRLFATTLLESGQMKWLANLILGSEKTQEIVDANKMQDLNDDVDSSLIKINTVDISGDDKTDVKDIEVVEISGNTFYANMIIVKDPSRVSVASIYPWRAEGVTLEELVKSAGAVGGINGGIYNSTNNSGGAPFGVLVSNGEIQLNEPQSMTGLVLIGLDSNNILQIVDMTEMSSADVEQMVSSKGIRDAVTFQEEASDTNNHFVQLIINNEERQMNGIGSGLNPRTAIGQREDGALLLLVTDGRGRNGHLGASAADLISIMKEYGAVNAANLDGGSSSCMYYDNEYLMKSVTFYYAKTTWKLPAGFVIK